MTTNSDNAHGAHAAHNTDDAHDTAEPHPGESVGTYLIVYAALIILLVLTAGAAFVHLGRFAVVVAMLIASVKAALVILYFMHVRLSNALVKFFCVAAFFWLGILFVLTFSDYLTRTWLPNSEGWSPPATIEPPN